MAAVEERRFPIMGSAGHLVVVGGPDGLVERGIARLDELELRWSRFQPSSELSQLNDAGGTPCVVSADTMVLIDALRSAWERSGGRFDPTVHDGLAALGYATSWPGVAAPPRLPAPMPAPGCAGLRLDAGRGVVWLPAGVHLDPGGLGKGLAADLVAAELLAEGAEGVLVNVGGDLRVDGCPPSGDSWRIAIEHPSDRSRPIAAVDVVAGAVATSTSARRRWPSGEGAELHHLLDPATGRPAMPPWTQVTVVAGVAWWAEVLATVAFLDGHLLDDGAAALVVRADGSTHTLGEPAWFATALEASR